MYKVQNENGTIEVSEAAIKGFLTQFIEGKNFENVKFLGFKKTSAGVENFAKGLSKVFSSDKNKKQQEVPTEEKLVFHLDFQMTKLHPVFNKATEIQEFVVASVIDTLGVAKEEVEVHVYFSKFQEEK